jgi:hypothetical protein
MLKRRSLVLRPADSPRLPADRRRLCRPASRLVVAHRPRGPGYRASESLPELKPLIQPEHRDLSDTPPKPPPGASSPPPKKPAAPSILPTKIRTVIPPRQTSYETITLQPNSSGAALFTRQALQYSTGVQKAGQGAQGRRPGLLRFLRSCSCRRPSLNLPLPVPLQTTAAPRNWRRAPFAPRPGGLTCDLKSRMLSTPVANANSSCPI